MKKQIITAVAICSMLVAKSQNSITSIASSTVITPIVITKISDLNFGNISVQSGLGGTVVLNPNGSRLRTAGITLPATSGTVTAATFRVDGEGNFTYSITLPTSVTLNRSGSNHIMTANNFISNPTGVGNLSGGIQNIGVGATLFVAAGQLAGVYASNSFDVTVNYN